MAGMSAKMVMAFLETQDLKVTEVQENVLAANFGFQGGSIQIFIDFSDSDTHVHLEGVEYIKVSEDNYDKMYKVLNECNDKYTHVKWVLNTKMGQIVARDDDVIQLDSCGPECFELILRMVKVAEDAYPVFMKAMWS